jgi:glycosyltransferase involved in cell wall biosynthesis
MTPSLSSAVTIAVTVYDRRDYIIQAIQSALDQTIPVKVIVVEDCGPDVELQSFVKAKFGNRIQYLRNPRRRGLFDNWNACLEFCTTPFLSILHDDDFLDPMFIAEMEKLVEHAPDCGFYFGTSDVVNERGIQIQPAPKILQPWRKVPLRDFIGSNVAMFPGQLIRVEAARSLGGFRSTSLYCGDYEMWAKLTANFGAAQTSAKVATIRSHHAFGRGTSRVERSGKLHALTFVQQKRIVALLNAQGIHSKLDRADILQGTPMSLRFLLRNAAQFSPRMLNYNYRLLMRSRPNSAVYAAAHAVARVFGPASIRCVSKLYRSVLFR